MRNLCEYVLVAFVLESILDGKRKASLLETKIARFRSAQSVSNFHSKRKRNVILHFIAVLRKSMLHNYAKKWLSSIKLRLTRPAIV